MITSSAIANPHTPADATPAKAAVTKPSTTKPVVKTKAAVKPAGKALPARALPTLRRGVKKAEVVALVEKYKFPTTPFTLKQIVYAFGIDHWYIVAYVKKNAKVVGDAPKAPGVRGKAAKLYQMPATVSSK